jgi:hypothetical protein
MGDPALTLGSSGSSGSSTLRTSATPRIAVSVHFFSADGVFAPGAGRVVTAKRAAAWSRP